MALFNSNNVNVYSPRWLLPGTHVVSDSFGQVLPVFSTCAHVDCDRHLQIFLLSERLHVGAAQGSMYDSVISPSFPLSKTKTTSKAFHSSWLGSSYNSVHWVVAVDLEGHVTTCHSGTTRKVGQR